jgi:hypothetical protein
MSLKRMDQPPRRDVPNFYGAIVARRSEAAAVRRESCLVYAPCMADTAIKLDPGPLLRTHSPAEFLIGDKSQSKHKKP